MPSAPVLLIPLGLQFTFGYIALQLDTDQMALSNKNMPLPYYHVEPVSGMRQELKKGEGGTIKIPSSAARKRKRSKQIQ